MDFNFTSQICTTKEQSERLLALGVRKETADMGLAGDIPIAIEDWKTQDTTLIDFPAWSLHRLIEIIPKRIKHKNYYYHFNIFSEIIGYIADYVDPDDSYYNISGHRHNNLFEGIISLIEWLIKEGYFNKEYLEE